MLKTRESVLLKKLGIDDPLLAIAKNLEQAALKDDYFVSRKLYPNVDFYSGIIMPISTTRQLARSEDKTAAVSGCLRRARNSGVSSSDRRIK